MTTPSLESTPALSRLRSLTEPEAETLVDILAHPLWHNPPTDPEVYLIVEMFAPWLDEHHQIRR